MEKKRRVCVYILLCLYNNRREDMYSFQTFFFIKMGQSRPLFVYFRHFLDTISIIQIEKKRRCRTRGSRMVGAEETTELWRPPFVPNLYFILNLQCLYLYSESVTLIKTFSIKVKLWPWHQLRVKKLVILLLTFFVREVALYDWRPLLVVWKLESKPNK